MIKKRNKKAQFYLIAAIVIIGAFLGLVSVLNYSERGDNPEVYYLVSELNIEGENVLDYEAATGASVFEEFAKNYSYYVGEEREIHFIVGESGNLDNFWYDGEIRNPVPYQEAGGNVSIEVHDAWHTFELQPGQNFYFVMVDTYKDQEYFVTNIE